MASKVRGHTLLACAALCAIVMVSNAGARASSPAELIDVALEVSGFEPQIERFYATVLAAVPKDALPNKRPGSQAASLIRKAAGKEALLAHIRKALKKDFDHEKIWEVIGFYDSTLGEKIRDCTERSAGAKTLSRVWRNRKKLVKVPEPRYRLLERIVRAERVQRINRLLLDALVRGLAEASVGSGEAGTARADKVRQRLKAAEERIKEGENLTQELAIAAYADAFRTLSDEELSAAVRFKESPASIWFTQAVSKGLENAAYETGLALGRALPSTNGGR